MLDDIRKQIRKLQESPICAFAASELFKDIG